MNTIKQYIHSRTLGNGEKKKEQKKTYSNQRQVAKTYTTKKKEQKNFVSRLCNSLVFAIFLLFLGTQLCKVAVDEYLDLSYGDDKFSPAKHAMVTYLTDADFWPLELELRTLALSGCGMAAFRLGLNHWLADNHASSIVAILFSLFLVPIGCVCLQDMYFNDLPLEVCVGFLPDAINKNVTLWGPHVTLMLCGGNIFNGYIAYELVWELAVHKLNHPAEIIHHPSITVFSINENQ